MRIAGAAAAGLTVVSVVFAGFAAQAAEEDEKTVRELAAPADLHRVQEWDSGDVMFGGGPSGRAAWPAMIGPDGSLITPDTARALAEDGKAVTFFDLKGAKDACGDSPDCIPNDPLAGPGLADVQNAPVFPVPLPAALALLGLAMALLALFGRRSRT